MSQAPVQILYIDDSAHDRELVRDALEVENEGFELTEARNREEFLQTLDTDRFDLVLTDFNILGYKGLQVLDVVKARDQSVPVVIVTGTGSEEVAVEAMKRGASDYVIKSPTHIRRLPLTIQHALRVQRAEAERQRAAAALAESERRYRELSEALEGTVRERTAQLRELASQAALAERDERHRIALVLHDEVQQLLYSLQVRLPLLLRTDRPEGLAEAFSETLTRAVEATRTLTVDLSPPVLDGGGLAEALQWLAPQMERLHGLRVEVDGDVPPLDQARRVLLFQFARELLFNVVKHAGVDEARVELSSDGKVLTVRVEDQGIGFDAARALDAPTGRSGFGLRSIRERLVLFDGDLDVDSPDRGGAVVTMTMPLTPLSVSP